MLRRVQGGAAGDASVRKRNQQAPCGGTKLAKMEASLLGVRVCDAILALDFKLCG